MRPEVQLIAITRADGSLAIMHFVTKAEFIRVATDEAINAEIAKAGIRATSWRRITLRDLPTNRIDRDAWIDTGSAIMIDPARRIL